MIGVDLNPQPDYCGDAFIQADAIKWMIKNRRRFDAVHASPPCQEHSLLVKGNRGKGLFDNHVDMIPETRRALMRTNRPWVMENVPTAPMRQDVWLCGLMFGLDLFRHRRFELEGFSVPQLPHPSHRGHRVQGWRQGVFHEGDIMGVYGSGGNKGELKQWQNAMNIHWSKSWYGLAQAIPPNFTNYIGKYLFEEVMRGKAGKSSAGEVLVQDDPGPFGVRALGKEFKGVEQLRGLLVAR